APSELPQGAKPEDYTVAFWNGTAWEALPTTVTTKPDGSLSFASSTTHFTLFGIIVGGRPTTGAPTKPAAQTGSRTVTLSPGWTLVVWTGVDGTPVADEVKRVVSSSPNAVISIWRIRGDGSFEGYLVGAPAFAQAGLEKLPANQPIIVGMRAAGTLALP